MLCTFGVCTFPAAAFRWLFSNRHSRARFFSLSLPGTFFFPSQNIFLYEFFFFFYCFVALFKLFLNAGRRMLSDWTWDIFFLAMMNIFFQHKLFCVFPLLELFLLHRQRLKLLKIVRKVSPTRTVKAIATEKDLHPAGTGGDVLSRVVGAPALHEANSDAVRIDGTELHATNRWWPRDGFVDSKILRN